jgi:nucleotide-binding universal stress UspA family protein
MKKKLIVVPTDFSKVGHTATNHAIKIAQSAGAQVMLVHIVPDAELLEEAKQKLSLAQKLALEEYNFNIETLARVGTIYEDVTDLVEEFDASLVVMGTHGLRGMQFITGSRALRVITSGKVPFVVVQEKQIGTNGYDDIVVPLDLNKETKQKLNIVAAAAKYFSSRVHIIVPGETDDFLKNQIDRNMNYAKSFFDDLDIPYTTHISKEKSDDFDQAVLEYAHNLKADLIVIMNLPGSSLAHLFGGNYVQNIITNKDHIPVIVVNPKETTTASIFGAYSGAG